MRNKYHSKKIHDPAYGWFDSIKEYNRWNELKVLEKNGTISRLERQVPYELLPKQVDKKGKTIERAVKYKADFVYKTQDGLTVVEDAKGVKTKEYILKRKMMLYFHGVHIREV